MRETQEDIERLQVLLDTSIERAGAFLRRSFQMPEHSLTAQQLIDCWKAIIDRVAEENIPAFQLPDPLRRIICPCANCIISRCYYERWAASACCANFCRTMKNSFDWPMNSPSSVKALTAPMAAPFVSVGRMIEQTGNMRLRKMVGSGMIRLVWKSSPPKGGELRSGNTNPLVGSVRAGALPALSCQV